MRRIVAALAALLTLSASAAHAASPVATLGVYRGAATPTEVAKFEAWNNNQKVTYALDFLPMDSWGSIANPAWWADGWRNSPYRVIYSVPMLPKDATSTLAAGANGSYDTYFYEMASTLVAHGQANAILRLGWEFNGSWFPWNAAKDPSAFVTYWRRIVTKIRTVPGQHFLIDWTSNLGQGTVAPSQVYPGDSYVDVIGTDAYDQGWATNYQDPATRWDSIVFQPYGLQWLRDFAVSHGKPVSIPEWGLTIRSDGHGGGDNSYYPQHMYDWIAANNVLYNVYFEFDTTGELHRMMLDHFPVGSTEFKSLFHDATPTPTPTPTPSPTPTATPTATATPYAPTCEPTCDQQIAALKDKLARIQAITQEP